MEKVELYRQVFISFKEMCAAGRQPSSFRTYCKNHGVDQAQMPSVLIGEFQKITTLPGYRRCATHGGISVSIVCCRIYEEFKRLCAEGRQPGTFKSFYESRGITREQIRGYLKRHRLKVAGLPGFIGPSGVRGGKCQEVPFEDVIFEEAGFLPADENVITVSIDGHVAVSFPADTDVETVAKFVRKMRKEVGHVES